MLASLKQLSDLYSRGEKRNSAALFLLMVGAAAFEVIGLAAVPAFVTLLGEPDRIMKFKAAQEAFRIAGANTFRDRILWGAMALSVLYAMKNAYTGAVLYLQARYVYNRQVSLASRLF